jgi:hypothetical protein
MILVSESDSEAQAAPRFCDAKLLPGGGPWTMPIGIDSEYTKTWANIKIKRMNWAADAHGPRSVCLRLGFFPTWPSMLKN